jgi:hypothetical protein
MMRLAPEFRLSTGPETNTRRAATFSGTPIRPVGFKAIADLKASGAMRSMLCQTPLGISISRRAGNGLRAEGPLSRAERLAACRRLHLRENHTHRLYRPSQIKPSFRCTGLLCDDLARGRYASGK